MSVIYDVDPPRLSAYQIEEISEKLLHRYDVNILKKPQPTPISMLIERHLGIDIDYKCLSESKDVLGIIAFSSGIVEVYDENRTDKYPIRVDRGTILIENDLLSDYNMGRGRFTMAHEVGHWILHKDICGTMFRCEDIPRRLQTNIDWFEWQADTFASSLLMPRRTFIKEFSELKKSVQGFLTYEERASFLDFASEHLSDIFQVSYSAAKIRMKKLMLT